MVRVSLYECIICSRLTHFGLLLWGYMKKIRVIIIAVLALLLMFAVFGWLFWSLGSIRKGEDPVMRLVILQGTVYVKSDGGFEEQAKSGMMLKQNDVVRTEKNAEAAVTVSGRSDLRLSGETQITINKAVMEGTRGLKFEFDLSSGRVWSRVMKLLDYNNVYESQADNVVATVRGTAYGLEKINNDILLYVDKAAVSAGGADRSTAEIFTPEQWALFDTGGGLLNTGDQYSTTTPIDGEWVQKQRIADVKFNEASKKYLLDNLLAGKGTAPDSWKSSLADMSESWHLRFSGEKCADLRAAYFGRKLYFVYDLASRGKSGLAYQYLSELQKKAFADFADNKCADKSLYANQSGMMLLALSDATPENELYKLKLLIEEMHVSFFDEHSPEAFWAHSLALDSRLDELERFDCKNNLRGNMQQSLDAVTQGILRQDRDFELLPADLDLTVRKILAQKTFAQNTRLNNFLANLETCKKPPMMQQEADASATSTTSTQMESVTSTDEGLRDSGDASNQGSENAALEENDQTNTTGARDQAGNLNLSRIQLFAQPNPVLTGGSSVLYVKGIKKDGSEFDATSYAKFEQTGGLGSISGIMFTAKEAGSVVLTARVTDNGQEFSSQVQLNITEPLIFSRFSATAVGGNTVLPGNTKNITATAYYTNGQSRNVTDMASYSLSDGRMGSMNGSTFTASANAYGQVVITVRYEEEGIMKEDQVTLQIGIDRIN